MHRFLVATVLCLLAVPASAKVTAKLIEGEEDLYFVEFQRSSVFTRGASFHDNPKKNEKKLLALIPEACTEEGRAYYRIVTTREIAESEKLKNYWEMLAGDEATSREWHSTTSGGGVGTVHYTYPTKRLVWFVMEEDEGFKPCKKGKK